MKIAGRRTDGALYLSIGAGHAVILKGPRVSPPLDESIVEQMGPWAWTPEDNTFEARTATQRALDLARVARTDYFSLAPARPWIGRVKLEDDAIAVDDEKKDEKPEWNGKGKEWMDKDEETLVEADFRSLDEDKEKKKVPVSEIAQTAQSGEEKAPVSKEEVMNLPEEAAGPPEQAAGPPNPFFPADERKKKRGELKDKIRGAVKSQKKVAEVLEDEDISDDDLFAMAKALGVTLDETPRAVTLVDNSVRYQQLLLSTTHAKHLAAGGGEHPFTYCKENVIPSMEKEGKGPDDPDAFCAWWKHEGPGS